MTVWATVSDVADVTGKVVSAEELAEAEAVLFLFSGRTPDDRIGKRDLFWLKQAVCWQAVWQAEQVAFAARSHAQSVTQDGLTVQLANDWQSSLAPLAARAVRNLSWKRTRVSSARRPVVARDFTMESSDPYSYWQSF